MRCLLGTYRNKTHIPDALRSLDQYVTGITDIVFINDSPNPETSTWLSGYGKVVDVDGHGYGAAMKAACVAAEGQQCLWWEEDFTATQKIVLDDLSAILYHRPYLAQIALLRGPHFPIEHEHGGLLEALIYKGHTITEVNGVLEQTATFTANPSVWRGEVFGLGWPAGRLSEELKRDQLLNLGYRFGYLPGIRVEHHGERTGFDY
jgi:glycosyltransferase involved in cell wall biosynthesis